MGLEPNPGLIQSLKRSEAAHPVSQLASPWLELAPRSWEVLCPFSQTLSRYFPFDFVPDHALNVTVASK
jgi:hypothetical protein